MGLNEFVVDVRGVFNLETPNRFFQTAQCLWKRENILVFFFQLSMRMCHRQWESFCIERKEKGYQ